MAVYKIFPEKSATLYSFSPTKNTGIDEILEVSVYCDQFGVSSGDSIRSLIKFPQDEIINIINTAGNSYEAKLKAYLADSFVPLDYTVFCYPVYDSWSRGTGRAANSPITTNGVSWLYSAPPVSWSLSSFPTNVTASYSSSIGGGNWYYNLESSQSFNFASTKDLEIDVTNAIVSFVSGTINNEGFILKHSSSLENNYDLVSSIELKYFSSNTHTIYPPCLEIKWDDSLYNTGSLSITNTSNIVISIGQNKNEYNQNSIQQFRVNVRDKNPVRTFQTSSLYLNNKLLPTSSYWSIKDLDTEEIIIDFDDNYTKLSADSNGNYFKVYMNGLQPERYYMILIKSVINGETIIVEDNNNIFKVIR